MSRVAVVTSNDGRDWWQAGELLAERHMSTGCSERLPRPAWRGRHHRKRGTPTGGNPVNNERRVLTWTDYTVHCSKTCLPIGAIENSEYIYTSRTNVRKDDNFVIFGLRSVSKQFANVRKSHVLDIGNFAKYFDTESSPEPKLPCLTFCYTKPRIKWQQ